MRQLVLHTGLVPASYIDELRTEDGADDDTHAKAIVITPADKLRLQAKLAQAIEECEECPICFNLLDDARITSCSHVFCLPWWAFPFLTDPMFTFFLQHHRDHLERPEMPVGKSLLPLRWSLSQFS